MNKKKFSFDTSSILFLAFALVAILVLMFEVNQYVPDQGVDLKKAAGGRTIGVMDSTYFNFPFYFSMYTPDSSWTLKLLSQDTVIQYANYDLPLLPQVTWYVEMVRNMNGDIAALSQTGILKWDRKVDPVDMAINFLSEILDMYETPGKSANILQRTITPAHHILQGAYWVALLPESRENKLNLWVLCVLPRRNLTYIVLSKTTEKDYPLYNKSFEKIVGRFEALSMLDKSVDFQF
ncbi:hypothetical protein JXQ31_05140 [candidate division KSB1 bacterium]|nr:hypothetical protein [candidate division KSB1 bacterium]